MISTERSGPDSYWIIGVFVAALLVRGALGLALGPIAPISDDQASYLALRDAIQSRHAFIATATGLPTAYRDPAYAWLLSWLGDSLSAIWVVQALLSAATGALLVAAAASAGRAIARATAVLFLLHLSFASYTFFVYAETLAAFALALMFWALSRTRESGGRGGMVVGGLAGSALLLARFSSLLIAAGAFAGAARGTRATWRRLAFIAVIAVLPTALWSVRNQSQVGMLTPNTNGAVNLYLGNNSRAPMVHGYRAMTDPAVWAPLGPLGEAERARAAIRLVRDYAAQQPARFALGAVMRVPDALEADRILLGVARRGQFPARPLRLLFVLGGVTVLVTSVPMTLSLACALHPSDHWLAHAARWALVGSVLTQALTLAHSRFTLLAWIVSLPGAALTWQNLRNGDRGTRTAVIAAALIVAALLVRALWTA